MYAVTVMGPGEFGGSSCCFFGFFVRENVVQEIVFRPDVAMP